MRCYPLSMRTTEPVVLSSKPLRHSRVSADARLISSSSTHSPCRSAVTSVPYHQGCKGLTSTRKHLIFFTKNSHRNNDSKRKTSMFYIALYTSPPAATAGSHLGSIMRIADNIATSHVVRDMATGNCDIILRRYNVFFQ